MLRNLLFRLFLPSCIFLSTFERPCDAQVTEYYHLDAQGNVRAITDEAGKVIARYDYLPFGEEWELELGGQPLRFGSKERDAETGFDYFGARYYGPGIGRFTNVDPATTWKENVLDPQRWNRYAYVRNNPFRYSDPDGREIRYASENLRTFFGQLAARSEVVSSTLALYEGPNNPDLHISQAALGVDPDDGPLGGDFDAHFGQPTTDNPPGSGDFSQLAGLTNEQVAAGLADASIFTSIPFQGGDLRIDTRFTITGITGLARTKGDRAAVDAALHELGHADHAARRTLEFFRMSLRVNQLDGTGRRLPHDSRPIEQTANQYRARANR